MCCTTHHPQPACDCCAPSCDCGDYDADNGFVRRYQTKAEQIAELEAYLDDMKTEMQAVEETLADLKK